MSGFMDTVWEKSARWRQAAGSELAQIRESQLQKGEQEYGQAAFLGLRNEQLLDEIKAEIADAMNWLEFLYVKLWMIGETSYGSEHHQPDGSTGPVQQED